MRRQVRQLKRGRPAATDGIRYNNSAGASMGHVQNNSPKPIAMIAA